MVPEDKVQRILVFLDIASHIFDLAVHICVTLLRFSLECLFKYIWSINICKIVYGSWRQSTENTIVVFLDIASHIFELAMHICLTLLGFYSECLFKYIWSMNICKMPCVYNCLLTGSFPFIILKLTRMSKRGCFKACGHLAWHNTTSDRGVYF
jgi:hypothetical protein